MTRLTSTTPDDSDASVSHDEPRARSVYLNGRYILQEAEPEPHDRTSSARTCRRTSHDDVSSGVYADLIAEGYESDESFEDYASRAYAACMRARQCGSTYRGRSRGQLGFFPVGEGLYSKDEHRIDTTQCNMKPKKRVTFSLGTKMPRECKEDNRTRIRLQNAEMGIEYPTITTGERRFRKAGSDDSHRSRRSRRHHR